MNSQKKKTENAELIQAVKKLKKVLAKIPDEELVRAIRESRDQR